MTYSDRLEEWGGYIRIYRWRQRMRCLLIIPAFVGLYFLMKFYIDKPYLAGNMALLMVLGLLGFGRLEDWILQENFKYLAVCMAQENDPANLCGFFNEVAETSLHANRLYIYVTCGRCLLDRGFYEEAVEYLEQTVNSMELPPVGPARKEYKRLQTELHRFEQGMEHGLRVPPAQPSIPAEG